MTVFFFPHDPPVLELSVVSLIIFSSMEKFHFIYLFILRTQKFDENHEFKYYVVVFFAVGVSSKTF